MKKFSFIFAFAWIFCTNLRAQDPHFSQFYSAPTYLNPALTGVFEGKYRVGMVYRDQWRKALDYPLQTFAINGDFRFRVKEKSIRKDAIGVGVQFFNDKVSVYDFNTTNIAVSAAYHKAIDSEDKQFLSLGLQYGLNQRNANYGALQFHDAFDGLSGYTLGTGEPLPDNNFAFSDLSLGLNYSGVFAKNMGVYAGVAMHHVLEPVTSFFKNSEDGGKLFRKYSAQMAMNLPINRRVSVLPRVLFALQGPHTDINAGSSVRVSMGQYGNSAFHVGSWIRARQDDGFGVDSAILLVGIEKSNVLLGLSYDLNIGTLSSIGRSQGAFEISVGYLGDYESEEIICPKF